MTTLLIFISCMPRLEVLLEREVKEILDAPKIARKHGGLELRVRPEELWRLSHDLRIAASIRVRIGQGHVPNFDALMDRVGRVAWSSYFARTALPKVQVRCRKSSLYHADAVRERVEDFFVQRAACGGRALGSAAAVTPDEGPTVHLRIVNDVATISVSAAEALYRRGLRARVHRAPLRETYAAACLRASGLDRSMSLADPVCGSGVFLTERAAIAGGLCLPRRFAFETWPTHDASAYAAWCAARPGVVYPDGLRMWGGDHNAQALQMAAENLAPWKAGDALTLRRADARAFLAQLSPSTDVIANPPWSKRLRGADAVGAIFGDWLRARPADATGKVVVLVTGHEFLRATGVRWREVLRFTDANTPVRLMEFVR